MNVATLNDWKLTEQFLIDQLKKGDEAAFREIVETRQGMVYNTVLGLLQNAEDAEAVISYQHNPSIGALPWQLLFQMIRN